MCRNYLLILASAAAALVLTSCSLTYGTRTTTKVPASPTPLLTQVPPSASVTIAPTLSTSGSEIVNTATETAWPTATVTPRWKIYQDTLAEAFLPQ